MKELKSSPWKWVPSLYFIEGIPYGVTMFVTVVMYKNLGLSNSEIAFYTSWLYLPWVIKPIWSPFIDILKTKKWWTVVMQFTVGVAFAGIAFTLPFAFWIQSTLALFWLAAFSSATHDIAADGFYLLGLNKSKQAFFVGIRSLSYRLSMLFTQGVVVWIGGYLEEKTGAVSTAWMYVLCGLAILMVISGLYHALAMPAIEQEKEKETIPQIIKEFGYTFKTFIQKDQIGVAVAFILIYRLGEAQLVKMGAPFLLDEPAAGGLGLSTQQVGIVYGTVGPIGLIIGGILGGVVISRKGLKHWIWYMLIAINLPQIVYVVLAYTLTNNMVFIGSSIFIETFGYGFGFTAYMVYMMYFADGKYKTAHYALCTGLMALGMMIPGLFSGWLQEQLGYQNFFIWVFLSGIPGFFIVYYLKINPSHGKD